MSRFSPEGLPFFEVDPETLKSQVAKDNGFVNIFVHPYFEGTLPVSMGYELLLRERIETLFVQGHQ